MLAGRHGTFKIKTHPASMIERAAKALGVTQSLKRFPNGPRPNVKTPQEKYSFCNQSNATNMCQQPIKFSNTKNALD
jgi:hypothetical protein